MELGGTGRGTTYDALNVTGALAFGGTLVVATIDGFAPAAGNSFDLFNFTTGASTFAAVTLPALGSNLIWDTSALYTTGVLSVVATAVPEPSAYAAFAGAGALALAWWRRRRA